jgi:hypothetical protein
VIFFWGYYIYHPMNENLNEVVAVGGFGLVVRPSIDCTTGKPSNDYNTVGKIAVEEANLKEYDIIQNLPVFPNAPYITIDRVSLCNIDPEWLSPYQELNDETIGTRQLYIKMAKDNQLTQLRMPYLGVDFMVYMKRFKNPFKIIYTQILGREGTTIMTVPTLKRLMHAINILYEQIDIMNDHNVFHGDIKLDNVVYDVMSNRLTLIDFGLSKSNISNKRLFAITYIGEKNNFFQELLKPVILASFNNRYIYQSLLPTVKELERLPKIISLSKTMIFLPHEQIDYESRRIYIRNLCNTYMGLITDAVNNLDERKPVVASPNYVPDPPYVRFSDLNVPDEMAERNMFHLTTDPTQRANMRGMFEEDQLAQHMRTLGRGGKRRTKVTKKRKTHKTRKCTKPNKKLRRSFSVK